MEEFLHLFQAKMEVPGLFSWFHFLMLIPIIGLTFVISFFFKNAEEKVYKRILFIFWIILVVLEVMKQLVLAFHYSTPSYWEYSIKDFPFSICSMILYFTPIILFVDKKKHPKLVDAATGYLCLISLFMGILVCIYTNMIMTNLIFINVQTLLHHGTQVIIGVYIFVWNRKNIKVDIIYKTFVAFLITAMIAIIINVSFYPNFINMFFINPTRITNLPIGNIVQEKVGYLFYLVLFLSLIGLVTYLTYLVETSIYKLTVIKSQ